jgi:hypothetical protein
MYSLRPKVSELDTLSLATKISDENESKGYHY